MKLPKLITIEEFREILKKEKDKKYKLAYVLAFGSGLRISEVIGYGKRIKPLTKQQINLKNHQIKVYGKGGKERITVTSPWLNETIIKILPLKINRRTLQRRFKDLARKTLGRDISFHTLRHGFANYMVNERDVPLPMLQAALGHQRLDTTGIYTKANPKKAVEKMWEAF